MTSDAVDVFLQQWRAQRPQLDPRPMGTVGRLHRATALLGRELKRYFNDNGIEEWEFDVLATLRRSGGRYTLTPKQLGATTMVGSSALTNRVDRLVARGLVTRQVDPGNRRSLLITLTGEGLALVDSVVDGHVANERRLLQGLAAAERQQLDALLRKLLVSLGDTLDPPLPGTVASQA